MKLQNPNLSTENSKYSDNLNQKEISQKSTNVGDSIPIDNSINHYELPNLSQLLYDFTNKEQEMIQRCFRTGNYTNLREIPHNIAPNVLARFQKDKIENNLNAKPQEPKITRLTGGGLFQEFEWIPDSYDNFVKIKLDEKKQNIEGQKKISEKPFVLGMNQFKWKYQDCFSDNASQKDYVFPFLSQDDPYEATKEEVLRAKWLQENKILNGDFKPAFQDKSLEKVTKQQLPDIVNYIKKVIMIDWAEVNFIIGTNPESFVEIKFDQKSIDTELGLKAYMNTLISTHEVISQFNLKRVLKYWGYKDDKHIYFMLAPSWIRFNPAVVYSNVIKNQTEYGQLKNSEIIERDESLERKVNTGVGAMRFTNISGTSKATNLLKDPVLYSKDIEI